VLGVSLHRWAGLGSLQVGVQALGVDGGMGDRSRGEGEGFWAGLASGYSLLLDAKQIRQGEGILESLDSRERSPADLSLPLVGLQKN
jgi:hypothetical protein